MTRVVDFEGRRKRRQQQNEAAADLRPKTVVHFSLDEVVEVLVAMSEPEFRSLSPDDFRGGSASAPRHLGRSGAKRAARYEGAPRRIGKAAS